MSEYHTGSPLLDHIRAEHDRIHASWRPASAPKAARNCILPAPVSEPVQALSATPDNPIAHACEPLPGSPLNPRLIFSNFFVGDSNRLAWTEAQRAALAIIPAYTPLYLYGSAGLGKTHLLQAIAHASSRAKRRVVYLTAERFMYAFVAAIKARTAATFKESFLAIDILLVDDIQFLMGKENWREFCHTLDTFVENKKQIVIAADRPPGDLDNIEERSRSRLAGGLCVEIRSLEYDLRVKILDARIAYAQLAHQCFEVPAEAVAHVASIIQTNGRDLDGAVNRLLAHALLKGWPHSIETAALAIRDLIREPELKKVKIQDIQKLVASHFNVGYGEILSARRTLKVVLARHIAMYLSKQLTLRSLPEIGRLFGGLDHTTVMHAVRKITALVEKDSALAAEISILREMLLL